MKVAKFNAELKNMSVQQLYEKLEQLRGQLFTLKLNARTSHVKNNSAFKQLRADIARVMTFMHNKGAQLSQVTR